jgi:TatD DNase family protein
MIFNTHTHINDDKEYFEVDKIISECKEENVTKLLVIAYDYKSSLRAIELANNYEGVYAAIGIHPSDITKENNTIENLEELLNKSKKSLQLEKLD